VARGAVLVGGAVADKPSRLVAEGDAIVVDTGGRRFVSRGGDKLDAALDRFPIAVSGRRCLDAGASTGGFTDCLLIRGAASVLAVDVGYGQLHPRLREDDRVVVRERTNIRHLGDGSLDGGNGPGGFDLIVVDLVLLVKPQFEVGHVEVSRGRGVVRDQGLRRRALDGVASALVTAGATIMGAMASPVLGPAGNAEYLLWARTGPPETRSPSIDVDAALAAAVAASPDAPSPPVEVPDAAGPDAGPGDR
jgi:23S rRNA (cytidine1920-2'-O)/16S rRNA (cytidine1409-2'-O)-methyltransferase